MDRAHGSAFRVSKEGGQYRCVALRSLAPGELLLVEEPCASTRDDVLPGLPSASVEWFLVHALLTRGCGGRWVEECGFACDVRPVTDDSDDAEVAAWLCRTHRCHVGQVRKLYDTVRCNAFGLESTLLCMEYGAAFYKQACRFNHSCEPNCLSSRLGGNMVIITLVAVRKGEELTHSYLPLRLLVGPRSARASHLHFECSCRHCAAEPDDIPELSALFFPPNHAGGQHGEMIGLFHLASASGDHDAVLHAGARLLDEAGTSLGQWPLAALELTATYLSSYSASLLQAAFEGAAPPTNHARSAERAASLQAYATARIAEVHEELEGRRRASHSAKTAGSLCGHVERTTAAHPSISLLAARTLADAALVVATLLGQAPSRSAARSPSRSAARSPSRSAALVEGAPVCTDRAVDRDGDLAVGTAWARLCVRFGAGLDWTRDDLPALQAAGGAEELHALLPRAPRASRPEQRDGFVNDGLLDLAGSAGLVLLDRLPSAGVGLGGPSSCSSSSGDAGAQRSSSTSSCTGWAFADDRLTSSALLLRAHEAFD